LLEAGLEVFKPLSLALLVVAALTNANLVLMVALIAALLQAVLSVAGMYAVGVLYVRYLQTRG
jgi:hypothetical protein